MLSYRQLAISYANVSLREVVLVAGRTPTKVSHAMRDVGEYLRDWRRLNRITQSMVAARANISDQTVRALEAGSGTVSAENLFRVLHVLGLLDGVVAVTDPMNSPVGQARATEQLPQRVRRQNL
jgi:DNA-binding XRE family transcriptional regulator